MSGKKHGLAVLHARWEASTGLYLSLLTVIGILTVMLVGLGVILLRMKRKYMAGGAQNDPEAFRPRFAPSPTSEIDETWGPPYQRPNNSNGSFPRADVPKEWDHTLDTLPPAYRTSIGSRHSEARGERFGRVRLSLLRNVHEVKTFAAMQRTAIKPQAPQDPLERWVLNEADGQQRGREASTPPLTAADFVREYEDQDPTFRQQKRQDAAREDLEVYLQIQNGHPSGEAAPGPRNVEPRMQASNVGLGIQGHDTIGAGVPSYRNPELDFQSQNMI